MHPFLEKSLLYVYHASHQIAIAHPFFKKCGPVFLTLTVLLTHCRQPIFQKNAFTF